MRIQSWHSVIFFAAFIPFFVFAQGTAGLVASSPVSSSSPLTAIRVIGRTRHVSFMGAISEVSSSTVVVITAPAKNGQSEKIISLDVQNAQVIKNGKKNVPIDALVPGDRVKILAQAMPDGTYMAQHIATIRAIYSKTRKTIIRNKNLHKSSKDLKTPQKKK